MIRFYHVQSDELSTTAYAHTRFQLFKAKHLIDETSKDKANAELKARTCEEDAERFRKRYSDVLNNRNADKARIDDLNKQLRQGKVNEDENQMKIDDDSCSHASTLSTMSNSSSTSTVLKNNNTTNRNLSRKDQNNNKSR